MSESATMPDNTEANRLLRESIRRKDQVRQLRAELEQVKAELATVKAERDEYAGAVAQYDDALAEIQQELETNPDEKDARIRELEREILVRDRTGELQKLAKEKGVKDEHFEAMQKLMGWKPDGEEHDPAKLGESLDALVGQYGFLKGEPAPAVPNGQQASRGGAAQTVTPTARAAGPGATRGAIPTAARDYDAQLAERYPDAGRLA